MISNTVRTSSVFLCPNHCLILHVTKASHNFAPFILQFFLPLSIFPLSINIKLFQAYDYWLFLSIFVVIFTGCTIAVFTTLVLIIRFCIVHYGIRKDPWELNHLSEFVDFFIIGVTVLVVAVPEGLPLAVTISLAYSVKVCYLFLLLFLINTHMVLYKELGTLQNNRQKWSKNMYNKH